MADVFISYSHKDRKIASELAAFLGELGYDVWWDYELVGGSNFRDQILAQLRAAKAVVVIWSPSSVDASLSKWPREEADEAERLKTLVPVRVPELSIADIPLGYRDYQTDYVTEPDRLLKVFEKKGVVPSKKQATPATPVAIAGKTIDPGVVDEAQQFARWKSIEKSANAQDFRDFLSSNTDSPLAELARIRLAGFEEQAYAELQRYSSAPRIQRFLKDFPESKHSNELTRRLYSIESAAWTDVAKSRDPERIATFLTEYPDGHRASEAREMLRELRLSAVEAAAWKKLGKSPTAEQLEGFIKEFPLGAYVDEARALLRMVRTAERRARKWAEIKDQPYNEPIRSFITEFEDGPEVDAARALLVERRKAREDGDWAKVKLERHAAPILSFLREHPGGAHEKAAIALLRDLPRLNETEAWAVVRDSERDDLKRLFAAAFPQSTSVPPLAKVQAQTAPHVSSTANTELSRGGNPAAAGHVWKPGLGFAIAAAMAVASVTMVSQAIPTRSGQQFGNGLALGLVGVCLLSAIAILGAIRANSSAWHTMGIAVGYNALAAAWTVAMLFSSSPGTVYTSHRESAGIWLVCSLLVLGLHFLLGRRPPTSTAHRLVRYQCRAWFAGLALLTIACAAVALSAGLNAPAQQWLQRLVNGYAFNTTCIYGCTSPGNFLLQGSLASGVITGVLGCLTLVQALRHKGLWGDNQRPIAGDAS